MGKQPWFANRGQIIQTVLAGAGIVFSMRSAFAELVSGAYFSSGAIVFYLLMAIFFGSIIRLIYVVIAPRPGDLPKPVHDQLTVPVVDLVPMVFNQLRRRCEFLIDSYRRIGYTNPNETKYPLAKSSWPEFGKKWEYPDATLYVLYSQFATFRLDAIEVFEKIGKLDDLRFPPMSETILMVDLLANLQRIADSIEKQLKT